VAAFGPEIICRTEGGAVEINRRCLGSKVFGRPEELRKLTSIVWPEIRRLAEGEITRLWTQDNHRIIILDAAVLLDAGWEEICHEIWVTFVPREEVGSWFIVHTLNLCEVSIPSRDPGRIQPRDCKL
jgi:phosphopantetheine adenylyltransferase/dephospho-CoA kinase